MKVWNSQDYFSTAGW